MIKFDEEILFGRLIKRYKRFFMDVELDSGHVVTAHTPNTGSLLGLLTPGNAVMLSRSADPKRKTAFTAQAIKIGDGFVGINTHLPNKLLRASLGHKTLAEFEPYEKVQGEVPYGPASRSRIDLLFDRHKDGLPPCYVELKSVTLKESDAALFPDAPSLRAQKHVDDLLYIKNRKAEAALIFIVQRQDCEHFRPAADIDKTYADRLKKAHREGLAIKAICASIDATGVRLTHEIPCVF